MAEAAISAQGSTSTGYGIRFPRITIQFCTQCKWMLRAAYFAQELMSTFSTSLGEVALQPSTGGTFIVTIHHRPQAQEQEGAQEVVSTVLWDRKTDGGFPETKELKRRVRDVIEPGRDLGHVDRHHSATKQNTGAGAENTSTQSGDPTTSLADKKSCEDCN